MHEQNSKVTPLDKGARLMSDSFALVCVLNGTPSFLALFLSTLQPLMSDRLDSRPDKYQKSSDQPEMFRR